MKRTKTLLLIVMIVAVVATFSLSACGLFKDIKIDEVKSSLKSAGYEVTVLTGEEYVQLEDADPFVSSAELETYLCGIKGNEIIHVFLFNSVDAASRNSDAMIYPELYSGQSNKVVYFATKQARKDAGIG